MYQARFMYLSLNTKLLCLQEMELIYDMRGNMEQLYREMSELRKSIQSCMDMQMQLQQSMNQEVLTGLCFISSTLPVLKLNISRRLSFSILILIHFDAHYLLYLCKILLQLKKKKGSFITGPLKKETAAFATI